MKKMYKAMALVLCAILLVAGSVMGTLAYLQAKTGTVKNTFTVGKVAITLQETYVDADGQSQTNTTGYDNFKLVPGREIEKNPYITVDAGSEDCYLFVEVTNNIAEAYGTINWAAGWNKLSGNIWYYDATDNAGERVDVFTSFNCTNFEKYEGAANPAINITAYAVQAEGFADANAAWTATFGTQP